MPVEERPAAPSLAWRMGSIATMTTIGAMSRIFLLGLSKLHVHGLEPFLRVLDERADASQRKRGLITVSNHLSVLDDPVMWASLPLKYAMNPDNMRWAMGSHDLAFRTRPLSLFFALGQVLPTHRIQYSPHGGPFQATMTQVIRLLSDQRDPLRESAAGDRIESEQATALSSLQDPFSSAELTYTTNGVDSFPVPSAYRNRRMAWVHVYPEGRIHQKVPERTMRYFRWGVARMILESEPCPDLIPIFIEGFEKVMPEDRGWPRQLPRPGAEIHVTFGEKVDIDATFGDLRKKWQALRQREREYSDEPEKLGILPVSLQQSEEAVALRKECTLRVRDEVLKLRKQRGYPEEDPKACLVDTWRLEGSTTAQGQMADGSWVKDE